MLFFYLVSVLLLFCICIYIFLRGEANTGLFNSVEREEDSCIGFAKVNKETQSYRSCLMRHNIQKHVTIGAFLLL